MRVLLLGDDLGVFLAVARSLGRRGVEVHLSPAEREDPALSSRYIRGIHFLPLYRSDPNAWSAALQRLMAEHDFRLVMPCSDDSLVRLEHHSDELGRERLAIPNPAAFRAFTDKAATRELALRLGVPVADGLPVSDELGAGGLEARLGLPLVVKPAASYRIGEKENKIRALVVRSRSQLDRWFRQRPEGAWLAEGFFPGEGVGVSVVAHSGQVLLAVQHRRLRTLFETGGGSVRTTETTDPRLLRHVEALAEATQLEGVAMFEFRLDRATGAYALLEVNPRFWGSLPLAVAAGADFPALAWDVLTGKAPAAASPHRIGLTKTNLTGEFDRRSEERWESRSAYGRMAATLSLLAFLPTLALPSRFDSWAADDPEPFRVERRTLLKRLAGALGKRVPGYRRLGPANAAAGGS